MLSKGLFDSDFDGCWLYRKNVETEPLNRIVITTFVGFSKEFSDPTSQ